MSCIIDLNLLLYASIDIFFIFIRNICLNFFVIFYDFYYVTKVYKFLWLYNFQQKIYLVLNIF